MPQNSLFCVLRVHIRSVYIFHIHIFHHSIQCHRGVPGFVPAHENGPNRGASVERGCIRQSPAGGVVAGRTPQSPFDILPHPASNANQRENTNHGSQHKRESTQSVEATIEQITLKATCLAETTAVPFGVLHPHPVASNANQRTPAAPPRRIYTLCRRPIHMEQKTLKNVTPSRTSPNGTILCAGIGHSCFLLLAGLSSSVCHSFIFFWIHKMYLWTVTSVWIGVPRSSHVMQLCDGGR